MYGTYFCLPLSRLCPHPPLLNVPTGLSRGIKRVIPYRWIQLKALKYVLTECQRHKSSLLKAGFTPYMLQDYDSAIETIRCIYNAKKYSKS